MTRTRGGCRDGRVGQRKARARAGCGAVGWTKARAGRLRCAAGAVGAVRRLPCGARSCGPSQNSLRSLRSLRSDSCDESDERSALRARPQALRSSAPQKRTAACPPAPLQWQWVGASTTLVGRVQPGTGPWRQRTFPGCTRQGRILGRRAAQCSRRSAPTAPDSAPAGCRLPRSSRPMRKFPACGPPTTPNATSHVTDSRRPLWHTPRLLRSLTRLKPWTRSCCKSPPN